MKKKRNPANEKPWKPRRPLRLIGVSDAETIQALRARRNLEEFRQSVRENYPPPEYKISGPKPNATGESQSLATTDRKHRKPDIEKSLARIRLHRQLTRELATIKNELAHYQTPASLKQRHPKFELWENLEPSELEELADGERFYPKKYASHLTARKFGIEVRTLKYDRAKLRKARRLPLGW